MKILINLNSLNAPLTGIGHYTKNLSKSYIEMGIDLVGIKNGKLYSKQEILQLIDNLSTSDRAPILKHKIILFLAKIPGAYKFKRLLTTLKSKKILAYCAKQGFVYHEPNFILLPYQGKKILTIHDLSFIAHPEFHPEQRVNYLTNAIANSINQADYIIADSDFTKQEISNYMANNNIQNKKIATILLGIDNNFSNYNLTKIESTLNKFGLHYKQYILSVATFEPRKNLKRLISAFEELPENYRKKNPLVLVGDSGWKNKDLFLEIEKIKQKKEIKIIGYVDDISLKYIYAGATIFAYPSLYEGFGLPIVEAMNSGVSVLTSNIGAMREVAGEAALLVDPKSSSSIKKGMELLLTDTNLRHEMEEKGLIHAKKFTWQNYTIKIIEILKNLNS